MGESHSALCRRQRVRGKMVRGVRPTWTSVLPDCIQHGAHRRLPFSNTLTNMVCLGNGRPTWSTVLLDSPARHHLRIRRSKFHKGHLHPTWSAFSRSQNASNMEQRIEEGRQSPIPNACKKDPRHQDPVRLHVRTLASNMEQPLNPRIVT